MTSAWLPAIHPTITVAQRTITAHGKARQNVFCFGAIGKVVSRRGAVTGHKTTLPAGGSIYKVLTLVIGSIGWANRNHCRCFKDWGRKLKNRGVTPLTVRLIGERWPLDECRAAEKPHRQ